MARVKTMEVNAVLSEEFDGLLEVLEIREQFESGAFNCVNCQEQVTHDNVIMVFPMPERGVGFLCSKPVCGVGYAIEPQLSE